MGFAKNEWMRQQEDRWSPTYDGRFVCEMCFEDIGIRNFIKTHSKSKGCSFCEGVGAKKCKSIDIDEVIEFIANAVNSEYSDPQNVLHWDSEEKCYMDDSEITDIESVIYELVESPHEEILELIVSAFDEYADWVHMYALQDPLGQTMTSLWNQFAYKVKHEQRFFFPRASRDRIVHIQLNGASTPNDILTAISFASKSRGLFRYLNSRTKIYRARRYFKNEKPEFNLENLGVPSKEVSKKFANRMSPAGIPIFYGSENSKTAISEVAYSLGDETVVAEFITNRKLLVLDLTLIPEPPSLFQEKDWELRQLILFLYRFRGEIMKEVDKQGHEHVDYIPSQIFTEFIRYRVKYEKRKIDGVIFPSVHNRDKKNFALFCDNSLILEHENTGKDHFLKYTNIAKVT